jgi:hypothetical protein
MTHGHHLEDERLLISKARAAELLSISVDTFERQVMPDVHFIRIGRRVLFPVTNLGAWVQEHSSVPLVRELPPFARRRGLK